MSIYNRNRNNISIQVNKDQNLSHGMWKAIQRNGEEALAYLPSEDKVNLALATTSVQCIADPDPMSTLRERSIELEASLAEAQTLLANAKKTDDDK